MGDLVKQCKSCSSQFIITEADQVFYDKISPTFVGKRYPIPVPTLCPECREQRRMGFRNEQYLYHRICDVTGEKIISQYHEGNKFPIYNIIDFYKRKRNTPSLEFDLSRPFFEQFQKLHDIVPRSALLTDISSHQHNSEYQNASSRNKNCYLVFCSGDNEDCLYGHSVDYCKYCVDCEQTRNSEFCYDCIVVTNCFLLQYSQNCEDCSQSSFVYNCQSCSHCFMCSNLVNQSYCIRNKQYTKEDYLSYIQQFNLGSREAISKFQYEFDELVKNSIHKYTHIQNSEHCTGNYIYNSKNIDHGFMIHDSENCKYCFKLIKGENCYDINDWGDPAQWCYECITVGKNAYGCLFCNECWPSCTNLLYCDTCASCKDCFGCIGLEQKEYCIFNRQYTPEEYEKKVSEIIEKMIQDKEWGEFFPLSISPFAYNKTLAQTYYPLYQQQTIEKGYTWLEKTYPINVPKGTSLISVENLPDDIKNVSENILDKAIICEVSKKPFKLTKPELAYYHKHNIPLPTTHPDTRYEIRMSKKSGKKLYQRTCDNCGISIQTTYSLERPEKVYCEKCYHKEIY